MRLIIHPVFIVCLPLCGCVPSCSIPPTQSHIHQEASVSRHKKPEAPTLKQLGNGHYRIRKPWTVEFNGRRWLVPVGYKTNGITSPTRIKRSLGDGVNQPETWAAVFHDWLFTQPGISRSEADSIFYDLMVAYGVPTQRAKLMYTAVKLYSMSKPLR